MTTALSITKNIHDWLFSTMPEGVASIVEMTLIALVYLGIFSVAGLFLVLMERRVAAWFQLRIGPNRVGFQGLLQTMADALKLLSKELTGTVKADKFLYNLAPYFVIISSLMALAVIPFTKDFHAFDINIGIFFLIAISTPFLVFLRMVVLDTSYHSRSRKSALRPLRSWNPFNASSIRITASLLQKSRTCPTLACCVGIEAFASPVLGCAMPRTWQGTNAIV